MTKEKLKKLEEIKKRMNHCFCSNVIYNDELEWLLDELKDAWALTDAFKKNNFGYE